MGEGGVQEQDYRQRLGDFRTTGRARVGVDAGRGRIAAGLHGGVFAPARARGWDPAWAAAARHSWREAG
jgi:hypothetical protein